MLSNHSYPITNEEFNKLGNYRSLENLIKNNWVIKSNEDPDQLKKDLLRNITVKGIQFNESPEYRRVLNLPADQQQNEIIHAMKDFIARILFNSEREKNEAKINELTRWTQDSFGLVRTILDASAQDIGSGFLSGSQYSANITIDETGQINLETTNFNLNFASYTNIENKLPFPGYITSKFKLTPEGFQLDNVAFSNDQLKKLFFGDLKNIKDEEFKKHIADAKNAERKNYLEAIKKLGSHKEEMAKSLLAYTEKFGSIDRNKFAPILNDILSLTTRLINHPNDASTLNTYLILMHGYRDAEGKVVDGQHLVNHGLIAQPWAQPMLNIMAELFPNIYLDKIKKLLHTTKIESIDREINKIFLDQDNSKKAFNNRLLDYQIRHARQVQLWQVDLYTKEAFHKLKHDIQETLTANMPTSYADYLSKRDNPALSKKREDDIKNKTRVTDPLGIPFSIDHALSNIKRHHPKPGSFGETIVKPIREKIRGDKSDSLHPTQPPTPVQSNPPEMEGLFTSINTEMRENIQKYSAQRARLELANERTMIKAETIKNIAISMKNLIEENVNNKTWKISWLSQFRGAEININGSNVKVPSTIAQIYKLCQKIETLDKSKDILTAYKQIETIGVKASNAFFSSFVDEQRQALYSALKESYEERAAHRNVKK